MTRRNQKKIINGLRSGETFRAVAEKVGVHHRTVQRLADREGYYSARSAAAYESDFNKKGAKVYRRFHPDF
jgi:IS30 family transposase